MMRAHGTDTPREIWQFGDEGGRYYEAIAACIRMRYRLLAYQYSLMAETHARGIPAVRIPALVFPEDGHLRETDDEMMLGDQMLVCPVTRPMYYLPGGEKIKTPPVPCASVSIFKIGFAETRCACGRCTMTRSAIS